MTDRITPFPGKRARPAARSKDAPDGAVLPFAQTEPPAPSLHRTDVVVAGANPLLNALAALAEARAGRRVIVAGLPVGDDWAYELGVQATFHRFIDAAAETVYALSPSRRLDFRHTPFPAADRNLVFDRLRARRRRILDADVMRLEPGTGLAWGGETEDGVRLLLAVASADTAHRPEGELAAMNAASEAAWGFDIPRAVFSAEAGQHQCIHATAVVLTSAAAIIDLPPTQPRVKRLGSALGPYADDAARESRAFDDILAAIHPVPHPGV